MTETDPIVGPNLEQEEYEELGLHHDPGSNANAAASEEAQREHPEIVGPASTEGSTEAEDLEDEYTLEELRDRASELDIPGRSAMNKAELAEAVAKAEAEE